MSFNHGSNLLADILIIKIDLENLIHYHVFREICTTSLLRNINDNEISLKLFRKWLLFLLTGFGGGNSLAYPKTTRKFYPSKSILSTQSKH